MAITVDAKPLLEGIKKIIKITSASTLNFDFKNKNIKITAMVNQYRMELNIPSDSDEELKFNIFSSSIISVLEGKDKLTLELDGSNLKFKSGRSRGNLVTLEYEDIPFDSSTGKELDKNIKDYIFDNLQRVTYSGKNVSEVIPLKIQIKDNKIKMLSMEAAYGGFITEATESNETLDFSILLKYANYITEIFSKDEDLKIVSTPSSVNIFSDTCKVILPYVADGESATIEQMEEVIKNQVIKDNLQGKIAFSNPKTFFADIDELRTFANGDATTTIKIIKKEDKSEAELIISSNSGVLKKKIDSENTKMTGKFESQFNLECLRSCLEKNLEGIMLLSFYQTFCTIKSSAKEGAIYIVTEKR